MFLKIPKMIFAKKCNDPPNKNHMTEAPTQKISSKSSNLVNHVIDLTKKEIKIILEKSQDLKKTNYELALKHFAYPNLLEFYF